MDHNSKKKSNTETGNLVEKWRETTIGEQVTLQRGFDITKSKQRSGNIPVISSGGISSHHDTAMVKGPGVILGRKGVVGSVYYVSQDYWPHDTTLWVKDFHGNDPHFVYYFFRDFSWHLTALDVGSANPTLNRNHVHPIPTIWPPLPEQRAIAHILSTLDDKIELNRRMNTTLEAMARAIFKSWFVDFDPVQAKMEGEEPIGMDAETAALFPEKLTGSEVGLIPEGWELKALDTFVELDKGLSYKGKFLTNSSGIPMVNLGTVAPHYGFLFSGLKYYSGEFKERHIVKPGSIIIANTDMTQNRVVLGSPAIVPDLKSKVIIFTHHTFAVRNNSSLPNTFIYYLLQNDEYRNRVKGFATGTTVLALPKEAILDYEFPMPPKELVDGFCQIAYLVHKKIKQNNEESNTFAALRDTLLPKLISGEIRINVGEAFHGS